MGYIIFSLSCPFAVEFTFTIWRNYAIQEISRYQFDFFYGWDGGKQTAQNEIAWAGLIFLDFLFTYACLLEDEEEEKERNWDSYYGDLHFLSSPFFLTHCKMRYHLIECDDGCFFLPR